MKLTKTMLRKLIKEEYKKLINESNKVEDFYREILRGAGWATDVYVDNFADGLTDKEKYQLMVKLSKDGLLFDETKLEDDSDDVPEIVPMSIRDIDKIYGNYNK